MLPVSPYLLSNYFVVHVYSFENGVDPIFKALHFNICMCTQSYYVHHSLGIDCIGHIIIHCVCVKCFKVINTLAVNGRCFITLHTACVCMEHMVCGHSVCIYISNFSLISIISISTSRQPKTVWIDFKYCYHILVNQWLLVHNQYKELSLLFDSTLIIVASYI